MNALLNNQFQNWVSSETGKPFSNLNQLKLAFLDAAIDDCLNDPQIRNMDQQDMVRKIFANWEHTAIVVLQMAYNSPFPYRGMEIQPNWEAHRQLVFSIRVMESAYFA